MYKTLECPYCNYIHIDENKEVNVINNGIILDKKINFFLIPHRKHTCNNCQKTFLDNNNEKSVSIFGYIPILGKKIS